MRLKPSAMHAKHGSCGLVNPQLLLYSISFWSCSGALAALLKELAKSGHGKRAMEVFDWLRGLEDGHELICLCDVYTYTTMISQCGSHQQLRRALELVAEMRGRGIACNVHTYSALMNVCIKANELDLALDVYKQLLSDSCTPNLVTYNTLIDVYGKTGQWEEAVKVLDALEHQVSYAAMLLRVMKLQIMPAFPDACNRVLQGLQDLCKLYVILGAAYALPALLATKAPQVRYVTQSHPA